MPENKEALKKNGSTSKEHRNQSEGTPNGQRAYFKEQNK